MTGRAVRAAAAVAVLALAGCGTQVSDDRQGPTGAQPDGYQDAQHVVVYRNADQVPNIAVFCLGAYGFASTLKVADNSGGAAPSLLRFTDYDRVCRS